MKRIIVLVAAVLITVSVLLLVLAPDTLSMIVVGCMWIAVILGAFVGLITGISSGEAALDSIATLLAWILKTQKQKRKVREAQDG